MHTSNKTKETQWSKTVTISTMSVSKFWFFKINDNDDPNKIVRGFCTLDQIVPITIKIMELCYGFMRKEGQGRRFGIDRYICFLSEQDKVSVSLALPEFELQIFNYNNHICEFHDFLVCHFIFTKYNRTSECTAGNSETIYDEDWLYMELYAANKSNVIENTQL